ncbi:MAG: hypothetical protein JWM29_1766 [Solirubrobacterales bacterium]|nr:hypothetical protein [Solirubrobacterales bacterium]
MQPELVTVLLWGTLTAGERSLLRGGREEVVLAVRQAYDDSLRQELTAAVEGHTGQHVLAFLSDSHLEPDIAIEVFVLARRAKTSRPPPARIERAPRAAGERCVGPAARRGGRGNAQPGMIVPNSCV